MAQLTVFPVSLARSLWAPLLVLPWPKLQTWQATLEARRTLVTNVFVLTSRMWFVGRKKRLFGRTLHLVRTLATAPLLMSVLHRVGAIRPVNFDWSCVFPLVLMMHYTLAPFPDPRCLYVSWLLGRIRTERLRCVLTNPTSSGNLLLKCLKPVPLSSVVLRWVTRFGRAALVLGFLVMIDLPFPMFESL